MCVSVRKRGPAAPQFPPNVRLAKGRDWARRLVPAFVVACLAIVLSVQVVLADTVGVSVNPTTGYPTTVITVDGTAGLTTGQCPLGAVITMTFYFYFDTKANVIAIRVPSKCANGVYDTGPLNPYAPGALATVGKHAILVDVIDGASGVTTSSAIIGSSIVGPALWAAERNAREAATLKA